MKKPHIVTVIRPVEGGIRAHARQLLEGLGGDFFFTVACPPEQEVFFRELGCCVVVIPLRGRPHPLDDWRTLCRLAGAVRSGSAVLLHAHGFKAGLVTRPVARLCRIPCLVTVHGELAHGGPSLFGPLYRGAERCFSRWTDGYISVSQWLARELVTVYGVPEQRIIVIPNGIYRQRESSTPPYPLPFAGGRIVGTVARLAPQKGVEYFVRAAAVLKDSIPDASFVVVGDGPLRRELETLAESLELQGRIHFTGYVEDVYGVLQQLDLYVQPSLSEGQGIGVLEAMGAGCPVVASDTGGLRELVRHGENGLLVPPADAAGLADAIAALLANREYAVLLAVRAKAGTECYDSAAMIRQTADVYRKMLEGRWRT